LARQPVSLAQPTLGFWNFEKESNLHGPPGFSRLACRILRMGMQCIAAYFHDAVCSTTRPESVPVFPSQLESYGFSFPNADVGVVKTSLQAADLDCLGTAHALYRRSSASRNTGRGVIAARPCFVGPSPSLMICSRIAELVRYRNEATSSV
jgi:hypothetical protein